MKDWLANQYASPDTRVLWLDEIFADTQLRPQGNLRNFGKMCSRLALKGIHEEIAFRTVNPKLVSAARRDFGQGPDSQGTHQIFDPVLNQVPDRRKFVKLNIA